MRETNVICAAEDFAGAAFVGGAGEPHGHSN